MSRRKNKRASSEDEVKLNMAAMLDMAFQLLTFFILTFKPAPVEAPIALRMPDASPLHVTKTDSKSQPGKELDTKAILEGVKQLTVSLFPDEKGELGKVYLEKTPIAEAGTQPQKVQAIVSRLHQQLTSKDNSFDRLVLQVGSTMRYDTVMQVVDACSQLKYYSSANKSSDGLEKLTKVTFVELPITDPKKPK